MRRVLSADHVLATHRRGKSLHRSRGHALMIAIIVLALASTITVTIVSSTVGSYRQVEHWTLRNQADCLAESGLLRARQALSDNADYTGELWTPTVPGPEYGLAHVLIEIEPTLIRIQATFPVDAPQELRVRVNLETPR